MPEEVIFYPVLTGNGEPEMKRDQHGRAYWLDGSRVLFEETFETPQNRAAAIERHKLTEDHSFDLDLVGAIVRAHGLKVKFTPRPIAISVPIEIEIPRARHRPVIPIEPGDLTLEGE